MNSGLIQVLKVQDRFKAGKYYTTFVQIFDPIYSLDALTLVA